MFRLANISRGFRSRSFSTNGIASENSSLDKKILNKFPHGAFIPFARFVLPENKYKFYKTARLLRYIGLSTIDSRVKNLVKTMSQEEKQDLRKYIYDIHEPDYVTSGYNYFAVSTSCSVVGSTTVVLYSMQSFMPYNSSIEFVGCIFSLSMWFINLATLFREIRLAFFMKDYTQEMLKICDLLDKSDNTTTECKPEATNDMAKN